jgi:hypothetical protein
VADYVAAATAPDATYDGLRALYDEVARRNWLDAAVLGPDGKSITLGELIVQHGTEAKNRSGPPSDGRQSAKGGAKEKVA